MHWAHWHTMPISHLQYILIFYTSTIYHISIIQLQFHNNNTLDHTLIPHWSHHRPHLAHLAITLVRQISQIFFNLTMAHEFFCSLSQSFGQSDPWFQYFLLATSKYFSLLAQLAFGSWVLLTHLANSFGHIDPWSQYLLLATSAVSGILYHVHSQTSIFTASGCLQQPDTSYRLFSMASS